MKTAATLFILSVCYIASTEQAQIVPPSVHTYPRSWEIMQRETQRGMANMNAAAYPGAKAQFDIPTDPQELYECANQECGKGEESSL